jgi:hypothetical protein
MAERKTDRSEAHRDPTPAEIQAELTNCTRLLLAMLLEIQRDKTEAVKSGEPREGS